MSHNRQSRTKKRAREPGRGRKTKLFLLVLLALLSVHTGCTAGNQLQRGINHAVCLLTADVDCIRNMYDQGSNQSGLQTEGPSSRTERSVERGIIAPKISSGPVTRGSETFLIVKTKNKADLTEAGGRKLVAENIRIKFGLYNQFQVRKKKELHIDQRREQDQAQVEQLKDKGYSCSEVESEGNYSQLECKKELTIPVTWKKQELLPQLEPGEPWQKKYHLDTSQLEPEMSSAYQRFCGGEDCTVLTEPPYSFKINGTISYDFETSGVLSYRVYGRGYWKEYPNRVEKEVSSFCSGGKQTMGASTPPKTPIQVNAYVLGCELFEGEEAKIFLQASTKHSDDQLILKEGGGQDPIERNKPNCERKTDAWTYEGGQEARWQCSREIRNVESESGETLTFSFKLPYRLKKSFERKNVVRILAPN